jgi:[ribosomal protein S5]-alanine N-acetyltransferase
VVGPLETARLRLRPFEPRDADAVFAVLSDPEVGRWVGGAHASVEDSRALIERARARELAMWAVEERETGALVGEVGLQPLERVGPEVEIGWTIGRPWWGRGYATEAAARWLDVAFATLALDEVLATVLPENAASHRVAEKLGMRRLPELRDVWGGPHVIYSATNPAGASARRAGASSASLRSGRAAAGRRRR